MARIIFLLLTLSKWVTRYLTMPFFVEETIQIEKKILRNVIFFLFFFFKIYIEINFSFRSNWRKILKKKKGLLLLMFYILSLFARLLKFNGSPRERKKKYILPPYLESLCKSSRGLKHAVRIYQKRCFHYQVAHNFITSAIPSVERGKIMYSREEDPFFFFKDERISV